MTTYTTPLHQWEAVDGSLLIELDRATPPARGYFVNTFKRINGTVRQVSSACVTTRAAANQLASAIRRENGKRFTHTDW